MSESSDWFKDFDELEEAIGRTFDSGGQKMLLAISYQEAIDQWCATNGMGALPDHVEHQLYHWERDFDDFDSERVEFLGSLQKLAEETADDDGQRYISLLADRLLREWEGEPVGFSD